MHSILIIPNRSGTRSRMDDATAAAGAFFRVTRRRRSGIRSRMDDATTAAGAFFRVTGWRRSSSLWLRRRPAAAPLGSTGASLGSGRPSSLRRRRSRSLLRIRGSAGCYLWWKQAAGRRIMAVQLQEAQEAVFPSQRPARQELQRRRRPSWDEGRQGGHGHGCLPS